MKLINKIKNNYYVKLIQDNFKDSDFIEANKSLLKLKNLDTFEYNKILYKTINHLINQKECSGLFNKNIIQVLLV